MISTPRFTRRRFLAAGGASLLLSACATRVVSPRHWSAYPFTLGVASGSPVPDGIVLWTRLAPMPLSVAASTEAVELGWEIAHDEAFREVVRAGSALAEPEFAYSVHVEVDGLAPGRWYWYRFLSGDAVSPTGRTRTAPAPGTLGDTLRFAFASCQHYEHGHYGAHRHMADEDLDLVVFLGDYIYESSWGRGFVRQHNGPEPYTLEQYRGRHAQYKSDPDLQRCHARFPWIVTWDDHEVDNDYANDRSQDLEANFLERRAAAYRAYYEHMPLRKRARPRGTRMRIYGSHDFGTLARFHVLDDRQYRSHQACPAPLRGGSNMVGYCPERLDPSRTMLGSRQEAWLARSLDSSSARWNIIAQQTLMAQVKRKPGPERIFWTDGWDGYPEARQRLLSHLHGRRPANPVVIGGDVHSYWVCDLKRDFDDPASPVVASEFVTTSISSHGPSQARLAALRPENPHVKLADGRYRGYTIMELTQARCTAQLRAVDDEKRRETGIATLATYVVEDGRPGARPA